MINKFLFVIVVKSGMPLFDEDNLGKHLLALFSVLAGGGLGLGAEPCPLPSREADSGGQKTGDICSLQGLNGLLCHQYILLMIIVNTQKLSIILKTPLEFKFQIIRFF